MPDQSTNTLGKYQIIREIARSNDIVYEAIDPTINRRIALKELCMPPNLTGEARRERIERFWREGKAAGRLTHPSIVTIYEVGKDGDRCFIAMEYLEGQTLRDYMKSCGKLSIKDAVSYTSQLCSALAYAHANGIIHRDLKPENVQVIPGNYVKLTDFGIARIMNEPGITQSGQVFGTPSYMSPEQVAGKHLDNRSDIFSLGVLLYEMVTGQKPFTGDSLVTITYNVMNLQPADPVGVPPFILHAIKKAMAKQPDERYQNAEELAEDLKNENTGVMMPIAPPLQDTQSPFGNYQQTPYGTPMQGSYQPGSQSVPDPFSQQQNTSQQSSSVPPVPMDLSNIPYTPTPPLLSAETRNFLGIFFLMIGVIGMLFFAGWAVKMAYKSYTTSSTSESAQKYFEQGQKLEEEKKYDEAITQWQLAIESSPDSKFAKDADDAIFRLKVKIAYEYANARDYNSLEPLAKQLITQKESSPEGYYYLGFVYQNTNKIQDAIKEYTIAEKLGGNDVYAIDARTRRQQLENTAQ